MKLSLKPLSRGIKTKEPGTSRLFFVALIVASIVAPANLASAATLIFEEDWSTCTSTNNTYYTLTGGRTIGILIHNNPDRAFPECVGWSFAGQSWLSQVTSSLSPPPAVGTKAMLLNEGNRSSSMGAATRTLTDLIPGGIYELEIFAWKDDRNEETTLEVKVESGASSEYTMYFDRDEATPQTIRLIFPVEESTATITLTGGVQSSASPVIGSVKVELFLDPVEPGSTVFFLPGEGAGEMEPQTGTVSATLRPNTFEMDECTFIGWLDYDDQPYIDEQEYDFSDDLILTAQWSCPEDRPDFGIEVDNYLDHYREDSSLPDTL